MNKLYGIRGTIHKMISKSFFENEQLRWYRREKCKL